MVGHWARRLHKLHGIQHAVLPVQSPPLSGTNKHGVLGFLWASGCRARGRFDDGLMDASCHIIDIVASPLLYVRTTDKMKYFYDHYCCLGLVPFIRVETLVMDCGQHSLPAVPTARPAMPDSPNEHKCKLVSAQRTMCRSPQIPESYDSKIEPIPRRSWPQMRSTAPPAPPVPESQRQM
jgi:hypothetical protein